MNTSSAALAMEKTERFPPIFYRMHDLIYSAVAPTSVH